MPAASITSIFSDLVADHGITAVFVLMLVDAVLPAASELVMVSAGAVAAGVFSVDSVGLFGAEISTPFWVFFAMASAGTIGYTLGSVGGWAIGLYGGRPFLERHGKRLHLGPERLERAERWFDRRGEWAVFIGRLTPVVRSFISIPAGLFRQPLALYTLLTLVGSAIWCFALAGAGWGLGESWETFHHDFRYVEIAVVVLLVALVAYLLIRRRRSSRAS